MPRERNVRHAERQETHLIALLLAAATAAPGTVPDSMWPAYQYTSEHNAVFEAPDWRVSWKADIAGKNNGGIAIVGDTVYVESFAKKLFAFDAVTGRKKWERSFDDVVMTTPLVGGDLIYVGSGVGNAVKDDGKTFVLGRPEGNDIIAVSRTNGEIVWRFHTAGQDMPTGVLAHIASRDVLVFHNGDEHVRALDAASGSLLWERAAPGNVTMSSLALYEGSVYGVSFASNVWFWDALKRNDKKELADRQWTWAASPADGTFAWKSAYGGADSSPTVSDGIVFAENTQFASLFWTTGNALWPGGPTAYPDAVHSTLLSDVDALDAATGKLLWRYLSAPGPIKTAGTNIQAIAGVYVAATLYQSMPLPSEYAAFDGKTGRIRWKIHTKEPVKMGAVVKEGELFFGDTGGNFYVVRASDGAVERTITFSDPFGCSPPVIVGDTLFVTDGNTLYALRVSDLLAGKVPT